MTVETKRLSMPSLVCQESSVEVKPVSGEAGTRFHTQPLSATGFLGFAIGLLARRIATAETGLLSYGLLVQLRLLSSSFHKDAVTFDYRPECASLTRNSTSPTKHARRRTSRDQWSRPPPGLRRPR